MIATRPQDIRLFIEEHGYPVEINKPGARRSERQNRLYWQWMTVIGNHLGYSKDDMHDLMLAKFAPSKEVMDEYVLLTTSNMTPTQMSYYMTNIGRWAFDEFELILPEPDDNKEIK